MLPPFSNAGKVSIALVWSRYLLVQILANLTNIHNSTLNPLSVFTKGVKCSADIPGYTINLTNNLCTESDFCDLALVFLHRSWQAMKRFSFKKLLEKKSAHSLYKYSTFTL